MKTLETTVCTPDMVSLAIITVVNIHQYIFSWDISSNVTSGERSCLSLEGPAFQLIDSWLDEKNCADESELIQT